MTTKAKRILFSGLTIFLIISLIFSVWASVLIYKAIKLRRDVHQEIYLDVPDSDLNIVIRRTYFLTVFDVKVYYVKKDRLIFKDELGYLGNLKGDFEDFTPFEEDCFDVINLHDATFKITWEKADSKEGSFICEFPDEYK